MVEIISRISKGSKMDQIYIQKQRVGMPIGSYVRISEVASQSENSQHHLNFYGVSSLEKIKIKIIDEITSYIGYIINPDNIIFTGSFLDKGFNFNDLDILIISDKKLNLRYLQNGLESNFGASFHILPLSLKELNYGIATDPIYSSMLSRCVSQKKLIFKQKNIVHFKLLDLHLLKSKPLLENFDLLTGKQKYALTRNLISILLFIEKKKVTQLSIDNSIKHYFNISAEDIKNNLIGKSNFIEVYKKLYGLTFSKIMANIKNGAK